jgi:UDP-glucose 4-epimerase
MRVLVTGGAGFIGSNLVDALLARGDDVAVLDDLSTGKRDNVAAGARLREGDIRDGAVTRELLAREQPELVFHVAAQIDVRRSVADPAFDARVNVEGTLNLLEAAREAGVRRFVNSSTGGAIYGDADVVPTPETAPPRALSPYGQSKHAAEGYCDLYGRLHGLSVVSLRYSNVYGPRQDPKGEGGVIAIFTGCLRDGGRATVFGDGTQTRDFVHVGDVVAANLAAGDSGVEGAFNVGTGVETSLLTLVEALGELGGGFEPEFASARPGEVHRSALDATRAAEVLRWRAGMPLADGLRGLL